MASVDKEILYGKLGEAIKVARTGFKTNNSKKLTQQDLANKLGIKRTSITNLEAGNQYPPLHLIYEISVNLNVKLKDLLPAVSDVQLHSIKKFTLDNKTISAPDKIASYVAAFSKKGDKS